MTRAWSTYVRVASAAGVALTLVLSGCGQPATSEQAPAEEAVEEEASTEELAPEEGDTLEVSAELAPLAEQVRAMAAPSEAAEDANLDAYEIVDGDAQAIELGDEVSEASEDDTKSAAGLTIYQFGGMQLMIPSTWHVAQDGDGYSMLSPDGGVYGYAEPIVKEKGYTYDVSIIAANCVDMLAASGYTDIEVLVYDTLASPSGKTVDAYIQCRCKVDGVSYIFYFEYLESKSYINYLSGCAPANKWDQHFDDISTIINSVSFVAGEAI